MNVQQIINRHRANKGPRRKETFARITTELWVKVNERRLQRKHTWQEVISACFEKYLHETESKKTK